MSTLKTFLRLIRFEHTAFALPYVYIGMLISPDVSGMTWLLLAQVTLCAVFARTSAMALNRIIDERIDERNPRTKYRKQLIGKVGRSALYAIAVASTLLLIVVAYTIHPILALLAPIAAAIFFVYPYMKRATAAAHFMLGLALSVAPVGGFLSVQMFGYGWGATLALLFYCFALLTWVAGFDIIYSFGDIEFDRRTGLHSIPAKFGRRRALTLTSILYGTSVVLLFAVVLVIPSPRIGYSIACTVVAIALGYQLILASGGKWKRAFDLNVWLSPIVLLGLVADTYLPFA
jgi:4-hydroxybenzoate polyprenyltransferase